MTEEIVREPIRHPASKSDDTKLPALFAALAKAQGEFQPVERDKRVVIQGKDGKPGYSFFYAELASVIAATRPALSKHGLAVFQPIHYDGDTWWLLTIITHAEGAALTYRVRLPGAEDIKAFGGQITYLRRYTYAPAVGVASEDDVEEDGDGADPGQQQRGYSNAPRPPAPPPPPAAPKFYPEADFKRNLPAWEKLIVTGEKTPEQIIATVESKGRPMTQEQKVELAALVPIQHTEGVSK